MSDNETGKSSVYDGFRGQPTGTLFFAAGPNDESNGLYGSIVPAP